MEQDIEESKDLEILGLYDRFLVAMGVAAVAAVRAIIVEGERHGAVATVSTVPEPLCGLSVPALSSMAVEFVVDKVVRLAKLGTDLTTRAIGH